MTVDEVKVKHPMPWTSQVNYDLQGRCRMMDANGKEIDLFVVMAIAVYASQRIATGQPVNTENAA